MRAVAMTLGELEILANEAVGEAGGNADLIDGEGFLVQEDDTSKILDVAADGAFTVPSTLLERGELVS